MSTFGDIHSNALRDAATMSVDKVDLAKSLGSRRSRILKLDPDRRLVTGVVYSPCSPDFCEVDAQDDVMKRDELERVAHNFLANVAKGAAIIDAHHTGPAVADVVESYLAPVDFTAGDPRQQIAKGTWIMTVRVNDAATWQGVQSGELNAFSIGGTADRVPAT